MSLDDLESRAARWVLRASDGDPDAFGELCDLYVEAIHRRVAYKIRNRADAEDVTEQTFAKALQHISSSIRAAFAVLSPTPPPAPSPSSTVPIPSPGREARAVPSPPSQSVPTVESVRAPTARAAVQGFYTALNDALTRDPANFARAYGYLSDAARAQTTYAAFVARYQPDTGGIAARASRREIGTDATWTVVVDVVELRGATRIAELVSWTLVPTSKGWRLDHASVQAAPDPTATLMPGRRQDQHDQRRQDQQLDQQGEHNGRASPACTPSTTGGTSPIPTTCPGTPPARRGGSGDEPGGQKSD